MGPGRVQLKNHLLHGLFEGLVAACRCLPPRAARLVGSGLGRVAHAVARGEVRRAESGLLSCYEHVLGLPGDGAATRRRRVRATSRRLFANLGAWSAEMCAWMDRLDGIDARVVLPRRSARVLDRLLSVGRGVIWLTGHIGHWELMSWALARRGYGITAVGRRSYHPGITDLVNHLRRAGGVDILMRDDPLLPAGVLGALRRNRIVGMLVDQSTGLPSRDVPFLGRPAPTVEAPVRLALRHRRAAVFGWIHEAPAERLVIEIDALQFDDGTDLGEAMRIVNRHVENAVLAHPDHWVWMHPRWERRPGQGR